MRCARAVAGTLAVTAIFFTLLWLYAAVNRRLVDRNLDPFLAASLALAEPGERARKEVSTRGRDGAR